jgi:hypothetical protein
MPPMVAPPRRVIAPDVASSAAAAATANEDGEEVAADRTVDDDDFAERTNAAEARLPLPRTGVREYAEPRHAAVEARARVRVMLLSFIF